MKHKSVCSVHFEERAYACPSDIYKSSLSPSAVPTLIQCPNPPPALTPKRPPPRLRVSAPPSKKQKCTPMPPHEPALNDLDHSSSQPAALLSPSPPPHPTQRQSVPKVDVNLLKRKLANSQTALRRLRSSHYLLKHKFQRLIVRAKKQQQVELKLREENDMLRKQKESAMLETMPPIPTALMQIML